MNEHSVTDLLERAGAELRPDDLEALVAGGAARGRRMRRRRRLVAVAGAAGLAAAVLVPVLTIGGGSASVAPAGPGGPREIAVPREEMSATLAGLLPGSAASDWSWSGDRPYERDVQGGEVHRGREVVTMTIDARGVGSTSSPEERCLAFMGGPGCTELAGGAWTTEFGHVDLDARTGEPLGEQRVVRVWTREGYLLEAGARELGDDVLRAIALDRVWLR